MTKITDPPAFEEYRKRVAATVEAYGGKYQVRARGFEVLEGQWEPEALVVIEFESAERARAWWAPGEYRDVKKIREHTAVSKLMIVEGA